MESFDDLPTPFRSVTNLVSGEGKVFGTGVLADALLQDLPVYAARQKGADIVNWVASGGA